MKYKFYLMLFIGFLQDTATLRRREALVIEEEEGGSRSPKIFDASPRQDFLCSLGSNCVPLSDCHIMTQLLKRSCLQTDKLRGLTCGYRGREPLVCCPQTCPASQSHPTSTTEQCGRPQLSSWWAINYFGVGSHPWAVRIGFKNVLTNGIDYLCCGSIVNKRTILTAAHCALAKTVTHKIVSVKVGEFDYNQDPDCTYGYCAQSSTDVPLNHIVVHPNYDSKTFANNVALIVLKYPLNYSVSVQPICIYPKETNYIFVNQKALLIGWGKHSDQISSLSSQQRLEMPVLPLETCALLYGPSVPITETELCVGGEGKDACSGFGGAPLVLLDPHTKACYYQIGLLSFGSDNCGQKGVPSVYTRIDKYVDWIDINSPKG